MAYKPADFFIGVIDLFGILVPGAVLLYLDGDPLIDLFGLRVVQDGTVRWALFAIGSYVLGHFLLGMGVPLNRLVCCFWTEAKDHFYQEAKKLSNLTINPAMSDRTSVFYRAYAFLRLNNASALVEIERNMADYKLFRSLTVAFALDVVVQIYFEAAGHFRLPGSVVLCLLAFSRFLFLLHWTHRVTFEYLALLPNRPQNQSEPGHKSAPGESKALL